MSLTKNVPGWERVVRVLLGLGVAVWGVLQLISGSYLVGGILAVSGLGFGATGLVGWCPLCAMVGRTLPKTDKVVKIARI